MRIAIYDDYAEIYTHYLKEEIIKDIEQTLIKYDINYTKNARYLTANAPIYRFFVELAENHDILLL